jgi:hypothetical protein
VIGLFVCFEAGAAQARSESRAGFILARALAERQQLHRNRKRRAFWLETRAFFELSKFSRCAAR